MTEECLSIGERVCKWVGGGTVWRREMGNDDDDADDNGKSRPSLEQTELTCFKADPLLLLALCWEGGSTQLAETLTVNR